MSSVLLIHCVSQGQYYAIVVFKSKFLKIPLASKLLAKIIDILREEKRFRKHYLELLITQQLNVLDLSREGDEIAGYLQLASIRCSVTRRFMHSLMFL